MITIPHELTKRGQANPMDAISSPSARSARVLIVDDESSARKVLSVMLAQFPFSCRTAASGDEALGILENEPQDAVISDLQMPGMSGMDLLQNVRRRYPQVAFLVATGVEEIRVGVQAMQQGADDYLVKPFDVEVVVASLHRALHRKHLEREVENYRLHLEEMVAERTLQLQSALRKTERSYENTLEALGAAIDLRDSPTAGHSSRVFRYSMEIAKAMGGAEAQLRSIAMGAWLHDIGKLAIPDRILLKPGPLAEDPQGLAAEQIPLGARIFAVADTLDAMTSDRPYRAALPFDAARDEIKRGSGILYDPAIADVFLRIPNETWKTVGEETAAVKASSVLAAGDNEVREQGTKSRG